MECLEHKEDVNYLSLLIEKNLSWRNQIDSLILKISKTVGMIAKLRHFVPQNILLHIGISIILLSILIFLMVLQLGEWPASTALNRILILQKRCLRFFFFQKVELMLYQYFSILGFCLSISYTIKQCAALCTMSLTKSHPPTF